MNQRRFFSIFLVLVFLLSGFLPIWIHSAHATSNQNSFEKAELLLAELSTEEKIGQLFYVAMPGATLDELYNSWSLIDNLHVGGIYLAVDNDNFTNEPNALLEIQKLNNRLQTYEYESSLEVLPDSENNYIPLFLGISLSENNATYFASIDSKMQFPSLMAVGATWNTDYAYEYGNLLGNSLAMLGFNFFDGLSLDILSEPTVINQTLLGTQSFGGDPYWVGQMAENIVRGLHEGSDWKVAVIAQHFPDISHSDRDPQIEIPTISRSLEQLENIELSPYKTVMGDASQPSNTIDGIKISPVRYQGFQGNIRATTKPILFDQQILETLLSLPIFEAWRETSGLVITDTLNSQSIRHYDDPTGLLFNAPSIARDALIAGNDFLKFELGNNLENALSHDEFVEVINFFVQKYSEDVAFAERVDQAVLQILNKKYEIYPVFDANSIISLGTIELPEEANTLFFNINRSAVSLISPTIQELDVLIPEPPENSDKILIFTEEEFFSQCMGCDSIPIISYTQLEETILQLYGSEGADSIFNSYVNSYSFQDLGTILDESDEKTDLDILFNTTDWIVFLLADTKDEAPDAFSRLLVERPDLLERKNTIAFSLGTPNQLDTTAISKLTAYYALYSNQENVLDVAARILFKEISPLGAAPISVPSIGYSIIDITSPDSNKEIPFSIVPVFTEDQSELATQVAEDPAFIEFHIGDPIRFTIGVIKDHNGNPVPDGTPARIFINYSQEGTQINNEILAYTNNGMIVNTYLLEYSGSVEMRVSSGLTPATSAIISFNVLSSGEDSAGLTPFPTGTSQPIETSTLIATFTPFSTITPIVVVTDMNGIPIQLNPQKENTMFSDWLIMILVAIFLALGVYQAWSISGNIRWAVRSALITFLGNTITIVYLSFNLPGTKFIINLVGMWGLFATLFFSSLIGAGCSILIYQIQNKK